MTWSVYGIASNLMDKERFELGSLLFQSVCAFFYNKLICPKICAPFTAPSDKLGKRGLSFQFLGQGSLTFEESAAPPWTRHLN